MSPDGTGHEHGETERRLTRLETWMDARVISREVFEAHMAGINQRLDKNEENTTWLIRLIVLTTIGTIINGALFLLR